MTALLVVAGAAIGAPSRYLLDLAVQSRHRSAFPWGTFVVNLTGSLLLGGVAAGVATHGGPGWLLTLAGTGFCGAFTTFSTFGVETVRLAEDGRWGTAFGYAASSLAFGLAACALGWWVVSSV